MCSNATKSVYKRREQFLENLSLWHLCRTAVRINGVTIFRAARCLDTQEHDVHFQKLLQNAAKKSPFGWLWDALWQRKKNLTVSQSHPRFGQAEILFALATLCGELWERFGFERIWHIIALFITLHSCAILAQFFSHTWQFTLVAFWCSRAAGFYCFAGCMLHICALMWNTVKSI